MPDLSADRPLLLPEEQFTTEDVMLVAKALGADYWLPSDRSAAARDILTALAAAGRLLPPSAEHREEWSVWIRIFDGEDVTVYGHPTYPDVSESWAREFQGLHGGVIKRRMWHAGRWTEVDGSAPNEH